MTVDWRLPTSTSDDGKDRCVTLLLDRARQLLGVARLPGTRLVYDSRQMLRASAEIETALAGTPGVLHVGFQHADRFAQRLPVYRQVARAGREVAAFGAGRPAVVPDGVRWVEVPEDPDALANQWFLVSDQPQPIAFVGYELSPRDPVPTGPASASGRRWAGFVTDDPLLVRALSDHLCMVRGER